MICEHKLALGSLRDPNDKNPVAIIFKTGSGKNKNRGLVDVFDLSREPYRFALLIGVFVSGDANFDRAFEDFFRAI